MTRRRLCFCLILAVLLVYTAVYAGYTDEVSETKKVSDIHVASSEFEASSSDLTDGLLNEPFIEKICGTASLYSVSALYANSAILGSDHSDTSLLPVRTYMNLAFMQPIAADNSEAFDEEQPSPGTLAEIDGYYSVTIPALNCRADKDPYSTLNGIFTEDYIIRIIDIDEEWVKVTDGDVVGWVQFKYLAKYESPVINSDISNSTQDIPVLTQTSTDNSVDNSFTTVAETYNYTEDDLYWLALAITVEAGSDWISDEQQLLVGNVILNRVASACFPGTIYDVLHQQGQYPWVNSGTNKTPTQRAYDNALRLLNGERFCPDSIVFQAEFVQGSGIYSSFYDQQRNTTTYFCYM